MADRQLNRLQLKYLSVINLIPKLGGKMTATSMMGRKLFIKAEMDSEQAKKQVWDQIKLCDRGYPDLIADITVVVPPEPEPPPTKAPQFDAPAEPKPEPPPEVPPTPEPEDHPWPEPPHAKSGEETPPVKPVRRHTVQVGETLTGISLEYYGTPDHYMTIFKANTDILADPDYIFAGQELVIPELPEEDLT
jgi:hypothetical protein